MRRWGSSVGPLCFAVLLLFTLPARAQNKSAAPAPYGESSSELERLGKEILHAAKDSNSSEYTALIAGLAKTVPESWYSDAFGENSEALYEQYRRAHRQIEKDLESFFTDVVRDGATVTSASKHVAACDDDSGELIYPVLALREKQVPLYELRFRKGKKFHRLWALAYFGGAFHFVGELKPLEFFPPSRRKPADAPPDGLAFRPAGRIRVGGKVMAAQLIHTVHPEYPEIARLEFLQGKVQLHALIGRDGSVEYVQVLAGYCSLAEAAQRAVRQWQYRPTLLNGEPVEVDTTIEVVFKLRR
jgi:TonB family protein